ncbi:MAG: tRNA threonylcarbamoyladenosine dehydratase [Tannerellaceae bacterium]|jgi:tRNA A37 threonylcarbamoyladenosine dehydratase|nr:tRNA threonylcarbamoyladenosine dehydratase [Tannerellaceae bacterium]
MGLGKGLFQRTELLLGDEWMKRIAATRVILFGVGGVGSWCAESLIRSGIGYLTIVDSDRICVTNINRQLMATTQTVGQVKVEALKKRLIEINPQAEIHAIQMIYSKETSESFGLEKHDYIIDAIDSLENKAELIRTATRTPAVLFSSMGAALKMDASKIQVAEFWQVKGCPLGAALRRKLKKTECPAKKFLCVYSPEVLENKGGQTSCGTPQCFCPKANTGPGNPELLNHEWCSMKARINGTMAHTTAIFGFTLAGLVMQDICR